MSETHVPTIVVPTDFSESSLVAMSFALALSKLLKRRLLLLHIFTYVPKHRYSIPVDWMVVELKERTKASLALAKARITRASGSAETLIADAPGQPAGEILRITAKVQNPILVLGTHSRSGLERFFIGSTAEEVLRHAQYPVVTVGPHVTPFWHRKIRRLMLATDLTERSLASLPFLVSLWSSGMRLLVLHVASPDSEITPSSWTDSIRDRLVVALGENEVRKQVEFRLLVDVKLPYAIAETASKAKADLLAIGVHPAKALTAYTSPRTGFQIVMSAPCPVLSVCE